MAKAHRSLILRFYLAPPKLKSMKRLATCLLCVLGWLCVQMPPAQASGVADWTNRADLICVASFDALESIKTEPTQSFDTLVTYAVTMNVKSLWKGSLSEPKLKLKLSRLERNGPYFPFQPFSKNRNYLVFAQKSEQSPLYDSLEPGNESSFSSAIPIGGIIALTEPRTPLFSQVTRQIISGLFETDATVKHAAIGALSDYEWLFVPPLVPSHVPLGQTRIADLREMFAARALPQILRLARDEDETTRVQALETASYLQQNSVIAELAKGAESDSRYADYALSWGLLHFRNSSAIPLLVPQLKNKNPLARIAVIEALEGFRDRKTLPFLVQTLDDSDPRVRERALYALHLISGLPDNYVLQASAEQQKNLVRFWKSWRAN